MRTPVPKSPARARNILARHPLMKKGGVHQKSKKAERKAAKQDLVRICADEYPGKKIGAKASIFARVFKGEFSQRGLV